MERVHDQNLLSQFLQARNIPCHFSKDIPKFFLLRYSPGEFLTTPFSPSKLLQFVVKGDLLLFDMPDEYSTIMLQTTYNDVNLLGEVELLDTQFTPFFVEAKTEVYTLAIYIEDYKEQLLNDPVFLRYLCTTLSTKLSGAVHSSVNAPLEKRVEEYIRRVDPELPIRDIAGLAKTFNVSTRQLLRVLKKLCENGTLVHTMKGEYRQGPKQQ